ncbi:uncharacterized protein LOC123541413 [Mercenaria mercenaria]|uniref:uncharacterized protein LOC123541413 n=1 Tax=Mercenaria mercenaria TaxID=6596 RepID=UPI00234E5B7F|nr:uncharacterized protein LOC123541413 [Mercenaria mercenaria]
MISHYLVFIWLVVAAEAWSGGRQFVFAIPQPYSQGSNEYYLHMYISASETTNIFIEAPSISIRTNRTIQRGTTIVPLHARAALSTTAVKERKGIHIRSDKPINIYVVNHEEVYSDGFLVLPYNDISTGYYVSSYAPNTASEFAVASAFDNTHINITLRLQPHSSVTVNRNTYSDGHTFSLTMDRLDAFQIKHSTADVTGTFISSDRPIAVTSGNQCAQIPKGQDTCDYLVEQMPPVNAWKTKYIVASFRTKRHFRIRIITSENANRVSIGGFVRATLNRGQFYEFSIEQDYISVVEATHPVLVVQYNERHTIDNGIGDPFMVTIPSIDHFVDDYFFKTPTHFDSHHGSITILTSKVDGLRLDGNILSRLDEKQTNFTAEGQTHSYSVLRFEISKGSHHLTHVEPGVAFGMILYGYKHTDSYGLPLCWNMNGTYIKDVRIVNNTSSKSGIVEMLVSGMWTPVCSGRLDSNAAKVICKTLGYDKYGLPKQPVTTVSYQGHSSSFTGLHNMLCTGVEESLSRCKISSSDMSTCPTSDVVEINCAPSLKEIIQTTCSPTTWNVTVDMDKLKYRFPGSIASDIYLGENTCTGIETGHQLVFYHDIHSCLTTKTTTEQELVFNSQLVYAYHDPHYTFIIRSFNWTVDLHCHVPRDQSVHSNVTYNQKTDNVVTVLNSSSQYQISTKFFSDPNFMQTISGSPINVPIGTNVFVKSFVQNTDWTIKMRLHTCYTTTPNGADSGRYYLIKNGCEVDTNTHILSQTDHETKFVFKVFEVTTSKNLSVKCDAVICDMSDASSLQQCDQHCI